MSLLIKNAKLRKHSSYVDIFCEGGFIQQIGPNLPNQAAQTLDATGCLVTESFIDPHIHLDKVNIFDVVRPNVSGTLAEAIEIIWDKKKTYTDTDIVARAEDVLKGAIANGTLALRTHVDVDTIGGLKPLSGIVALREKYKHAIDIQIVAFPQEGIVKDPGCDKLMWQAMEMGADVVGGMPANESSPENSLAHIRLCFDIAQKYDAEVDMHVDETDDPFYRTLEMLADETLTRGWQNRVTAGHTCALAAYDDHYATYVIEKVQRAGIHMITNPVTNLMLQGRQDTQPIRRGITRVKELLAAGINVCYGQDCVKDTFYPFGSADMLQVANITGHAAQMSLPLEIEKLYDMITLDANKILKDPAYGLQEGNKANLVAVEALTERDAIRLCPTRRFVVRQGRLLAATQTRTDFYL